MADIQEMWDNALQSTEKRTLQTLAVQAGKITEDKIARIVLLTFLEELAAQIPGVDQDDLRDLIEDIRQKHRAQKA